MPIVKAVVSTADALKRKARGSRKKPQSAFGGFKKRTITAPQLAGGVVSLVPELGTMYRVWFKHDIDPGFREELMLAVSKLNDCRYCSWGHHEWALISGVPNEELAQLEQLDPAGFDRRKWLAISYVRALVKENFQRMQPRLPRRGLRAGGRRGGGAGHAGRPPAPRPPQPLTAPPREGLSGTSGVAPRPSERAPRYSSGCRWQPDPGTAGPCNVPDGPPDRSMGDS